MNRTHASRGSGQRALLPLLAICSLVACEARVRVTTVALPHSAPIPVTHGVAAGDVTASRAVVWARTDRYACMHVTLDGGGIHRHLHRWVTEGRDFAGKMTLSELSPDTTYRYQVGFSDNDALEPDAPTIVSGKFETAPIPTADREVSFGWSGDLGGINVCRDAREGYPIFRTVDASRLDFFIGLGDMVYADMACREKGFYGNPQIPAKTAEATTLREYWDHWKYNREDPGLRRLLATASYYAVWDDHEVANDFSPHDAWHAFPPYVPGADLLPIGRQALFDYNPMFEDPADPRRMYGAYSWGKHLELIVLDTRSYRDEDAAVDDPSHPKTLLGEPQRAWFEKTVVESTATWKAVVSSVPLALSTGRGASARDGWANYDGEGGSERELLALLRTFRDRGVRRLAGFTTDVHFATGLVYQPFPETPDFRVFEFSAGPLAAMLLAHHGVDPTLHPERLFFYGPEAQPKSWDEAKRYMNWGHVVAHRDGTLTVSIHDGVGTVAASVTLPADGTAPSQRVPL